VTEAKVLHEWKDFLGRPNRIIELLPERHPPIMRHEYVDGDRNDAWSKSMGPSILAGEVARLAARVDRLTEALRRYGLHRVGCEAKPFPESECTCGLREALEHP
jgi:hypothetical protein